MSKLFKICIQACINAYEGEQGKVKKVFTKTVKFQKGHTQGHVGIIGKDIYVVFEGSDGSEDWRDNFKFWKNSRKIRDGIKIHSGFYDQFKIVKPFITEIIDNLIAKNKKLPKREIRIICTGHSLGGALATLTAWHYKRVFPANDVICVTFGSPKVGNYKFAKQFNKELSYSFRFVYGMDTVCGVPPVWFSYWHVDNMIRVALPWYDVLLFPVMVFTGNPTDHYPQLYKKAIDKKY